MADVQFMTVPAPGWKGVNKQVKEAHLDMGWASEMTNLVFDDSGRVRSRAGLDKLPTDNEGATLSSPGFPEYGLRRIHFVEGTTEKEEFVVYSGIDDQGSSGSKPVRTYKWDGTQYVQTSASYSADHGGGGSITGTDWKFVDFNGKVVGHHRGLTLPVVRNTEAGKFLPISYSGGGTQPPWQDFVDMCSAYGRILMLTDRYIGYSAVLDETDWGDGQNFNFFELRWGWADGHDIPVAITEFNGHIIVFGQRSFIVYAVPESDIATMVKVEALNYVGLVGRECYVNLQYDLLMLTTNGLQSLGRVIQEKSMPGRSRAPHMRDYLVALSKNQGTVEPRLDYVRDTGRVYAVFQDDTVVFDTRRMLDDGSFPCTTMDIRHDSAESVAGVMQGFNGDVLVLSHGEINGSAMSQLLLHSGNSDGLYPIDCTFVGAWLVLGGAEAEPLVQYVKALHLELFGAYSTNVNVRMWADRSTKISWHSAATVTTEPVPKFNSGFAFGGGTKFNSDGVDLTKLRFDPMVEGDTVRVGWSCSLFDTAVEVHQMTLFSTTGKPKI